MRVHGPQPVLSGLHGRPGPGTPRLRSGWGVAWIIFSVAKRFITLRVSPEAELEGLDMPEFGSKCYPDFVLVAATPGTHGLEPDEGPGRGPDHEQVVAEPRSTPL